METTQRYTLGKKDKLKSKKQIELLFKQGKSFAVFPLRILYQHTATENIKSNPLQTAFSVSKKYFKKAVDRNRIKRLMREGWRLQKNTLEEKVSATNRSIIVFIIYTGKEMPAYELIFEKTTAAIKRLIKICNEATIENT